MSKNGTTSKFYFLFGSVFITFLVYSFSLFRPWQPFDERLFYSESLMPIPMSFMEIPEVINAFVLNYHIESMNSFFSNFMTIRSNPIATVLNVIFSFFFKKNALLWHIFQLSIHLINVSLVWFILKKTMQSNFIVSLFTLLWALHPVNTEAVLLVTNWNTILTYTFCLGFILFEINKISKMAAGFTPAITAILFCLTMFVNEYGYSLPLIVFFLTFSLIFKQSNSLKKSVSYAARCSLPYLMGLFLYFSLSLFRVVPPSVNLTSNINSLYFFIERNLWLSPQLFVHLLKLLFFPASLSTYQSNLTQLGNTLFDPYAIFCAGFYLFFLTLPVILFFVLRKKDYSFLFPMIYAFYFALFPNLHVLLPTYCLSADRYLYLPSVFLVLLLFQFSCLIKNLKPLIIICACILICLTTRTFFRLYEWNNPLSLYKSAINLDKNPLYKGQKLIVLADYVGALGNRQLFENSLKESLVLLSESLNQNKENIKKYPSQPVTLKIYGLDYESLLLKTTYAITTIKNDNLQESPTETLSFYEPYIKDKLNFAGINPIVLYGEILLKANEIEKAKNVLTEGLKKYPYSGDLLYMLCDLYLNHENDLKNGYEVLQKAYTIFPNQQRFLTLLYKYYEKTNDIENQAKFLYLTGLREHNKEAYQKAAQLYLNINNEALAKKALKKCIELYNKQG